MTHTSLPKYKNDPILRKRICALFSLFLKNDINAAINQIDQIRRFGLDQQKPSQEIHISIAQCVVNDDYVPHDPAVLDGLEWFKSHQNGQLTIEWPNQPQFAKPFI